MSAKHWIFCFKLPQGLPQLRSFCVFVAAPSAVSFHSGRFRHFPLSNRAEKPNRRENSVVCFLLLVAHAQIMCILKDSPSKPQKNEMDKKWITHLSLSLTRASIWHRDHQRSWGVPASTGNMLCGRSQSLGCFTRRSL